jgi:Tol biopolymer transport system component
MMKLRFSVPTAAAAALLLTTSLSAQDTLQTAAPTIPERWDVTAPRGPSRLVEFETSEGTWMNVDVSPDGRTLVFDLLGDIYTMPVAGGRATLILGGHAYETMPRFSPDGRRIAFTSDRDGLENIWTSDLAGGDLRQVSRERERQVSNPAWTPDGQYIVARKHFRNTRSLGSGEMWLYHVGGGAGLRMTDRRNWEQNATEPVVSPDGRYIYFSEDVSPGGGFQYNRDPHGVIYVVQRLDRESGDRESILNAPGGSLAPHPSPDGRTLAFVRRVDTKTVLMLHDLETGRERALWDGLDHDQQEVWAIFGTYPGYTWLPDGSAIVIWAQGGLWRVDVQSGTQTRIPFAAPVRQRLTEVVRYPQPVAPDTFDVRMLRWVSVSPDQRRVAYSALGKLYVKDLPHGTPRRVTRGGADFELYPSWSPDGRTLAYATWNDSTYGAIRTVRPDGSNARTLTSAPGHYVEPRFSPDGARVVYRRIAGDNFRGRLHSGDRGVYIVPANGGTPTLVTEEGGEPRFSRDGERIYLSAREDNQNALISVDLQGRDRRVHVTSENGGSFTPSPDERYVVWNERFNVHIAPFPRTGRAVNLSMGSSDYPVRRLSRDAGSFLHWSPDGRRVYWALGPDLYQRDIAQTFAFEAQDTSAVRSEPESAVRTSVSARPMIAPPARSRSPARTSSPCETAPTRSSATRWSSSSGTASVPSDHARRCRSPQVHTRWTCPAGGSCRASWTCTPTRAPARAGSRPAATGPSRRTSPSASPRCTIRRTTRRWCSARRSCSRRARWWDRGCSRPARSCTAPKAARRPSRRRTRMRSGTCAG